MTRWYPSEYSDWVYRPKTDDWVRRFVFGQYTTQVSIRGLEVRECRLPFERLKQYHEDYVKREVRGLIQAQHRQLSAVL